MSLSDAYGAPHDRAWLNLYRDHNDSTAWHVDKPCRPKAGGRSTAFIVHSADLIVMGGRCQRDWVHCVPKESRPAVARVSINFASRT